MYNDRLRSARIAAGLTQHDAADLLDVSESTIIRWETGRLLPSRVQVIGALVMYSICYSKGGEIQVCSETGESVPVEIDGLDCEFLDDFEV